MKASRKYLPLLLAALLGGCAADNSATNDQSRTITIGYNPTIAQPQALVGVVGGDYKKLLPKVKIAGRMLETGPDVVEQLRAETIQIGCSGPLPAMRAFLDDGDIVLLCNAANGGTQLMVRKDSAIKTVADLKGKFIGVNQLGSTTEAMVRYQLVQAKLNPNRDVQIVPLSPAEQAEALKSGDVQAVAAPAPWPSQVQAKANARALLDGNALYNNGNYSSAAFFTTKKFAQANPELVQNFVKATQKLTAELNRNRSKADRKVLKNWEIITKKTLKSKIAQAAFATIVYDTKLDESALQTFGERNFQLGMLRQKPDLNGFIWKNAQ